MIVIESIKMYDVILYSSTYREVWDDFVLNSKNATFLFYRNYLDYHSNRFVDCSLLIYKKNKLIALFPANVVDTIVYSHQGLTYGGLLMDKNTSTVDVLEIFRTINQFYGKKGYTKVVYKPIPYIYSKIPSQEDLYALFKVCNARLIGRNISSTIFQNRKTKFEESRKSGIRKAIRNGIKVCESLDFVLFWKILETNLSLKYGVKPVHTLPEIELLHSYYPEKIKLFLAYEDTTTVVAGTVIYLMENVCHVQYISASPIGKQVGALDYLFDFLINEKYVNVPIFDFGQSTEQLGNILNTNLIFQKEGFGGRGVVYDVYEYDITIND